MTTTIPLPCLTESAVAAIRLCACTAAGAEYYNESERLGAPGPVREDEIAELARCLGMTEDEVWAELTTVEQLRERANA